MQIGFRHRCNNKPHVIHLHVNIETLCTLNVHQYNLVFLILWCNMRIFPPMIDNFAECNNIACTFTFYIRMSIYLYTNTNWNISYSIKNQKYNWKLTFGSIEFAPFDSTEEMIFLIKLPRYNIPVVKLWLLPVSIRYFKMCIGRINSNNLRNITDGKKLYMLGFQSKINILPSLIASK